MQQDELIPHLFRTEYSKIVAVLCRSFNLDHLEVAEDIASDTFLKATEVWGIKGVPENPAAWLYTVAKNKTRDHFKHTSVFEGQVKNAIRPVDIVVEDDFEFTSQTIADSQLAMIFAVCDPGNAPEAQVCLALQILCGFSMQEIANAFLTNTETIKKRLQRGRAALRSGNFKIKFLGPAEIDTRLTTVLKTLYLLFNEGYFSKTSNQLVRKDLCAEAIRLAYVLTENPQTNSPQVSALLALMCFQSSRLDARISSTGEAILFEEQDKSLWDKELIEKGNWYMAMACRGNALSKYHLEAAIAYWHTTTAVGNKWESVLQLYNELILIEYSPVTALNRAFAFARVYGHQAGIIETEKLQLTDNNNYQSLLGYLYADSDIEQAIGHYTKAIGLTKSEIERQTLGREVERLRNGVINGSV